MPVVKHLDETQMKFNYEGKNIRDKKFDHWKYDCFWSSEYHPVTSWKKFDKSLLSLQFCVESDSMSIKEIPTKNRWMNVFKQLVHHSQDTIQGKFF